MNPIIKWAGGKRRLLPVLTEHAPAPGSYHRYFEPFLGSGALFFHLEPDQAVLSDLNRSLIQTYQSVMEEYPLVNEYLCVLAEIHSKESYYNIRETFNAKTARGEWDFFQAARFIYLNKTCFNGLWRLNLKGEYNVPMGDYKSPRFPDLGELKQAAAVLERSILKWGPFQHTIVLAGRGDFVYADPPYDGTYNQYTSPIFSQSDQKLLAALLRRIDDEGALWMASNSDTPYIRELYKNYHIVEVQNSRSINSDGQGRGKVSELLIKNY